MSNNTSKRILVSPLDWGLGHTTRCIPIIGELQRLQHTVIVACNATQASFIKNIYSSIEIVPLEGYNVTYSANDRLGKMSLLGSVPSICAAIKREHEWLAANALQLNIDGIISDNRYGLYHDTIPSVIMTHQLEVQTGMGKGANKVIQKLHYQYLERFKQVWVPDVEGAVNVGGQLSHPIRKPQGVVYIGLLSQFEGMAAQHSNEGYLLVLLSGPEPQRTILDRKLWEQVCQHKSKVVFVAGSEQEIKEGVPDNIMYYNRLGGNELAKVIQGADVVICRSGYSTIMDLLLFGKKAILIPTPGQTEQQYLAEYLAKAGNFTIATQKNIHLQQLLSESKEGKNTLSGVKNHYADYKRVVADWLNKL